jgi:hypothetical protein
LITAGGLGDSEAGLLVLDVSLWQAMHAKKQNIAITFFIILGKYGNKNKASSLKFLRMNPNYSLKILILR